MARPQGSLSKNKKFLLSRLQDMYGEDFHPIMKMAEIATDTDNDIKLRFDAWKEIAKYTEPQLRAVDHKIDANAEGVVFNLNYRGRE